MDGFLVFIPSTNWRRVPGWTQESTLSTWADPEYRRPGRTGIFKVFCLCPHELAGSMIFAGQWFSLRDSHLTFI